MKGELTVIGNYELEEVNGGGIGIVILAAGGALVGDYLLEKGTGKNAVQWVGTGLSAAGEVLQNVGNTLMN